MPRTTEAPEIAYDDLGRGRQALLFLPGWCANRTVFRPLLPLCAKRHRVLALDWRGHGESAPFHHDFGEKALVADALAVIAASGVQSVVPVALAHAGWVAIELRRQLGERVPKLVLLDWLVLQAPTPFLEALDGLQSEGLWRHTVQGIFAQWLQGVDNPELAHFVREEMGSYDYPMWARAGREITAAYRQAGSPVRALSLLDPPVPTLHLYAQPDDAEFLEGQRAFAAGHPWFQVQKLRAASHFPMFEVPEQIAEAVESFVGERTGEVRRAA